MLLICFHVIHFLFVYNIVKKFVQFNIINLTLSILQGQIFISNYVPTAFREDFRNIVHKIKNLIKKNKKKALIPFNLTKYLNKANLHI